MNPSTTAASLSQPLEMPSWKSVAGYVAAAFVALLFLAAGLYKAFDPYRISRMFEELLVPYQFSMALVLGLSVAETFGGALILVPRFRRWGAAITSILLVIFMIYIGAHYSQLLGKDCSCFPWIKRTVGPWFFVGDMGFLVAALLAGVWAPPVTGKKSTAAIALGLIAALAGVGFASATLHQTGTKAPDTVLVNNQPYSLQHGRIFIFFFDPECGHCDAAARHMSKLHWKDDVTVIGVPTRVPQFADEFLHDTKFKAIISSDLKKLKAVFPFGDPPYGVALEGGREIGPVQHFDDEDTGTEPAATLKQLGYAE